jgi:hypothetical protein
MAASYNKHFASYNKGKNQVTELIPIVNVEASLHRLSITSR